MSPLEDHWPEPPVPSLPARATAPDGWGAWGRTGASLGKAIVQIVRWYGDYKAGLRWSQEANLLLRVGTNTSADKHMAWWWAEARSPRVWVCLTTTLSKQRHGCGWATAAGTGVPERNFRWCPGMGTSDEGPSQDWLGPLRLTDAFMPLMLLRQCGHNLGIWNQQNVYVLMLEYILLVLLGGVRARLCEEDLCEGSLGSMDVMISNMCLDDFKHKAVGFCSPSGLLHWWMLCKDKGLSVKRIRYSPSLRHVWSHCSSIFTGYSVLCSQLEPVPSVYLIYVQN